LGDCFQATDRFEWSPSDGVTARVFEWQLLNGCRAGPNMKRCGCREGHYRTRRPPGLCCRSSCWSPGDFSAQMAPLRGNDEEPFWADELLYASDRQVWDEDAPGEVKAAAAKICVRDCPVPDACRSRR
jgi:hypothetical protein